jgi:hypothetical protein
VPRWAVWSFLGLAAFTAIFPLVRTFYRVEITYNEGWNVYNASALAHHQMLYPARYGWTTVNYPMLSFVIAAWLHRLTHDYLFTARALSVLATLACGVLAGCIVRRMTGSVRGGWITGALTVAIFCAVADFYVGQDDPEMLALAIFMAGLLVYVARRESLGGLVSVAALFVIGGNIKHDPLGFPAAVLLDLLLLSWRRLLWFCVWGALFVATTVWFNLHYGGPGFFLQLSTPRTFSWLKGLEEVGTVFGPLLLPLALAVYVAVKERGDSQVRILGLLLAMGLVLGVIFGGGSGVSVNAQFTAILATAMLAGIALVRIGRGEWEWAKPPVRRWAPVAVLAWMVIPLIVCDTWNPMGRLRETVADERLFDQDVALMRAQSGPMLCESLLRCYFAGKPYVYDPFNATRLIEFHKLDDAVIVNGLQMHRYAAVQLDFPQDIDDAFPDRFDGKIAATIGAGYRPVLMHDGAAIYLPR